jgi:hypothetical protein
MDPSKTSSRSTHSEKGKLMVKEDKTILLEDVKIIFRNFAGREGQYNREGDRNFCVLLDHETAQKLDDTGWNVKVLTARDEDEEDQPYLPVSVNFKGRPPRVVMVTSRGRTTLHEDEVELLDWADIRTVDLILNPYEWAVNGKTGIKAYLQSCFVTIEEDALELKYADVNDTRLGNDDG